MTLNSPKLGDRNGISNPVAFDLNKQAFSYTGLELKALFCIWASEYYPSFLENIALREQTTVAPEVLDKEGACEYLGGISLSSLNTLIREKKIIPVRPTKDRICFLRDDLRNYLLQTKAA